MEATNAPAARPTATVRMDLAYDLHTADYFLATDGIAEYRAIADELGHDLRLEGTGDTIPTGRLNDDNDEDYYDGNDAESTGRNAIHDLAAKRGVGGIQLGADEVAKVRSIIEAAEYADEATDEIAALLPAWGIHADEAEAVYDRFR